MTNIELYKKIRELVCEKYYKHHSYPMYLEQQDKMDVYVREEILHWMIIGEDAIKILEEDIGKTKLKFYEIYNN